MVENCEETKQARKSECYVKTLWKSIQEEGHGRGVSENSLSAYCCHDWPKMAGGDSVVLAAAAGGVLSEDLPLR